MRTTRLYATTLAGLTATAGGLALGYPIPLVVVVAIVAFGGALRGIAEPVFDDDYRVTSGGLVLGDQRVRRSAHSSALDIAGLALAASLLIHGVAVSGLQALHVVLGCVILVLLVIGWSLPRNRQANRQRWLTPRELVQVSRRYASQGPLRRLHAVGWVLFSLFASLRFVVLLTEREWARALAEFLVMIFWVAIAEHYCADVELQPAPTADEY